MKALFMNGGKYVAGSAVGVGFGHRGSSGIPGPHRSGLNPCVVVQRGSNEPTIKQLEIRA